MTITAPRDRSTEHRATILWRRLDLPGHELASLERHGDGWQLSGVALLALDARPCRLEYTIRCDAEWRTTRAIARGHIGAEAGSLDVARTTAGEWLANGVPVADLAGCDEVDLGFSQSTNLLPMRRLALPIAASARVRAAWVRFPELTLELLEQVYTRTGARTYVYESAGGSFRRELTVDADGFVLDYPGLWIAEARLDADVPAS